jgi:phosphodiesterase/alkaline phosphatase D-like protein
VRAARSVHVVVTACAALVAVGAAFGGGGARATPFGVRLTHTGDPTTSISVSWNLPPLPADDPVGSHPATDRELWLGDTPDALSERHEPDEVVTFDGVLGTSYTARLSGLEPARRYFYRVGGAEQATHSFRTASDDACDPVAFSVVGDNRTSSGSGVSALYADILGEAVADSPDFYVNTGDMVRNGTGEDQWVDLVQKSEPAWAQIATLPTIGNHDESALDGDGANYNKIFDLPRNDVTGTEDY